MKIQVYLHIAIRIIILSAIGMMLTYIPDTLRSFFGDVYHADRNWGIDPNWDWGSRHYWYFWTVIALFILSVVNFIISIVKVVNHYYPDL